MHYHLLSFDTVYFLLALYNIMVVRVWKLPFMVK